MSVCISLSLSISVFSSLFSFSLCVCVRNCTAILNVIDKQNYAVRCDGKERGCGIVSIIRRIYQIKAIEIVFIINAGSCSEVASEFLDHLLAHTRAHTYIHTICLPVLPPKQKYGFFQSSSTLLSAARDQI